MNKSTEFDHYYKTYIISIYVILFFMIIIPIVMFIALGYSYYTRDYAISQNVNEQDAKNEFLKSNNLPMNLNSRCIDYIKWIYSNGLLNPLYKSYNIKSIHDAYKWIICNNKTSDKCNNLTDKLMCESL